MSIRTCRPAVGLCARASAIAFSLSLSLAAPALAQAPRAVQVPAGPLDQALLTLARQTDQQLLYTPDLVAGRRTSGLSGRFTPEEATRRLLADADLVVTRVDAQTLAVKRKASVGPFVDGAQAPSPGIAAAPASAPEELEAITVTGSNIRGGNPASPVLRLDREALLRTGQATVAQALQTLPQAFGGETTEATANTRADRLGTNAGFGTALNLRGLGADSTLVLVNGRRLAGSGNKGDFADLSSIPAIAVERVEVLLDGASSVYGSDAVAGVVNVILRKDFEGAEVRVRGGVATRGGPAEGLVGLTTGRHWDGGGLLVAYEGYQRQALAAADRDFAASSDLRSLGGSDRRDTLAFPGNILRVDPATGATTPYWGVPTTGGVAPRPQDFQAGVINRQNQNLGLDLLPAQRRHSLYLAAHQAITPDLEVSGDLRYGTRRLKAAIQAPTSTLVVTTANPFFVSPIGASSHQVQYSFARDLPNPRLRIATDTLTATAGAGLELPAAWRADGYLGFAQEITETETSGQLQSLILAEALGGPDNPATAFRAAQDGYFNPFASQPGNAAPVLAAIGSGVSESRYRTRVLTANLQAEGPVMDLPAGELRLALGVQARRETYRRTGSSYLATAAPSPQVRLAAQRDVTAVFAEARAPLFGEQPRPLLQSLELSAAIRAERYEGLGTTFTPKAGLVWSPAEGLKVRASYGESFRAPALQETGDAEIYTPLRFQDGPARILTLALQGGNPNLEPETARTWTAGVDWTVPGPLDARLSANWFRTTFEARIDRPGLSNRAGLLTDPRLAMFVRRIDPRTSASDLSLINSLLADPATTTALGVFPATDYGAIVDLRYVNTSVLQAEGVDLQASLVHDLAGGRLTWSANSALMLSYRQKLTPAAPYAELRGTVGAPPRWRHRLTADWTRDRTSLGLALNHSSGLTDNLGLKVGDQTTLDATLGWRGPAEGRLAGLSVTLAVRNLFDADPPFYDNPSGFGFEPGSADTVGRFVAIQLSRSW